MPRIVIPHSGTQVDWPSKDTGRVHVSATLQLSTGTPPFTFGIELSFRPEPFRKLVTRIASWYYLQQLLLKAQTQALNVEEQACVDRYQGRYLPVELGGGIDSMDEFIYAWAENITETLRVQTLYRTNPEAMEGWSPVHASSYRGREQSLNSKFCDLEYRLHLDGEVIRSLAKVLQTDDGWRSVVFNVNWRLLPTTLVKWALPGIARGEHAEASEVFIPVVRAALFVATQLIELARKDTALERRIVAVMKSDPEARIMLAEEGTALSSW